MFAALGDETRLAIVARLCTAGPQSIVELTEGARVTRQAVTKHLHALAEAGLVKSKRDGRERVCISQIRSRPSRLLWRSRSVGPQPGSR